MSNTQKNLYACCFDLMLSDNSHFTGQILLLAQSPYAARASTNEWLRTKRPWRSDEHDIRTVTAGGCRIGGTSNRIWSFGFTGERVESWELAGLTHHASRPDTNKLFTLTAPSYLEKSSNQNPNQSRKNDDENNEYCPSSRRGGRHFAVSSCGFVETRKEIVNLSTNSHISERTRNSQ